MTRTGSGATLPAPYVLTSSDLTTLAAASDTGWLVQWGNVLVTAANVTAKDQSGSLFDAYGHMLLDVGTNGIHVGDKLYFVKSVESQNVCFAGPSYANDPQSFTSITGFVYLDFCNWSLAPPDKCHDLMPPSLDCACVADAGPDAGASVVCNE